MSDDFRKPAPVALLAEGVDRNFPLDTLRLCPRRSPSSQRAWIEISMDSSYCGYWSVALLAEGVDRNQLMLDLGDTVEVALLAEGVDRNNSQEW